jgi:type III secretory pathway component EscV
MDDTPGCWVQPDYWQQVTAAGRELWPDVHYFLTCHLEAVLRRNLNCFLGVQEVENLVEQWKKDPSLATLVSKALPTAVSRWRFTSLLRQLVRDLVPITNTPAILLAVQTSGLTADDVSRDVLAVRLSLREQLPGNRPASVTIEIPAEIEEKIAHAVRHESGRTFFALLPGDAQELLSAVRTLVGSEHRKAVAIVRDASVRQFFRSLVELEFPELLVIAREELLAEAGVVT